MSPVADPLGALHALTAHRAHTPEVFLGALRLGVRQNLCVTRRKIELVELGSENFDERSVAL